MKSEREISHLQQHLKVFSALFFKGAVRSLHTDLRCEFLLLVSLSLFLLRSYDDATMLSAKATGDAAL